MAKTKENKSKDLYQLLSSSSYPSAEELNVDEVQRALLDDPDAARRRYDWGNFPHDFNDAYPLWRAVALRASRDVVELIYDAYPEAIRQQWQIQDLSRMNTLHLACMDRAPMEVIRFLIEKYPRALQETSDIFKQLPLHYACGAHIGLSINSAGMKTSDLPVIQLLVEHFPPSVHAKDRFGRTPLQTLQRRQMEQRVPGNHADTMQWLEAVSRPLEIVSNPDSTREQMVKVLRTFGRQKWRGGVLLVFSAYPTLIQQLDLPPGVMPRLLSLVGARCKLQTMYSAIRGEPNLLQYARAVRRSKRKRKGIS